MGSNLAIVLACGRESGGGFNPVAIGVAIDLINRPGGPMALMQLVLEGITGASFYELWQGEPDPEPRLRALAEAFAAARDPL